MLVPNTICDVMFAKNNALGRRIKDNSVNAIQTPTIYEKKIVLVCF